jgi:amino acid transporter
VVWLRKHSKWGTPWIAIIVTATIVAVCTLLSFQSLVQIDQIMFRCIDSILL